MITEPAHIDSPMNSFFGLVPVNTKFDDNSAKRDKLRVIISRNNNFVDVAVDLFAHYEFKTRTRDTYFVKFISDELFKFVFM